MGFIRRVTNCGTKFTKTRAEKRNVILSNYISLLIVLANLFLVVARLLSGITDLTLISALISGSLLYLTPIVLNYFGFTLLSRIAVCWIPTIFLMYGAVLTIQNSPVYESSTYVGIRYMLVAASSFPFLVFSLSELRFFILAILCPALVTILYDPLLTLFNVGYHQVGLSEPSYYFNNVRAILSLIIIGLAFLFMKILTERSETVNERLIAELEEKNKELKARSAQELSQLSQTLNENVNQLNDRQFYLRESQRVASIGSWEYTPANRSTVWSDEMYDIMGLETSEKITAEKFMSLLVEGHGEILNAGFRTVMERTQAQNFTVQAKTPLGRIKWLRIYAYPMLDKVGVRGICHDITYYKEAEEQMLISENKYRTLFTQASDAIIIADAEGRFIDINIALCEMLFYKREDLLLRHVSEILDQTAPKTAAFDFSLLRPGDQALQECVFITRVGKKVFIEASIKSFGEGRVMIIARNITEWKQVQDEIRLNEAKFRSAFEESAIGMTLVSMGGQWIKVNRAFCEITGYSEKELLSKTYMEMTPEEDREADRAIVRTLLESDVKSYQFEKRYIHKNGTMIWTRISVSLIYDNPSTPLYFVAQIEDISGLKKSEDEKAYALYQLRERIKELTTLYKVSQILNDDQKNSEEIMQAVVNILPAGWQFPEVCASRILINESEFQSPNYQDGVNRQKAKFSTPFGHHGVIEVVYLVAKPLEDEGPFLKEERDLINMLAEMIRVFLVRKHEANELIKSEANLAATINNSNTLIWSVDREMKVMTYNKPIENFMREVYGLEIGYGIAHTKMPHLNNPTMANIAQLWHERYNRALAGEQFVFENESKGRLFKFSLTPIIVNDTIIGVSVFANEVTEERQREKQLAEATQKIGELKLMALRSVMSPHFIFNVLNSIQYYIAKNDRVNAINYLSTFSKLIRNVLTHSVDNKIKLSDELDLLRNYVNLELTRFENKFEFTLEPPDTDLESIEIPSLLIQPYVENSIIHGLYTKDTKGNLSIKVWTDEEKFVFFQIQDNGIGRKAARELRSKNFPAHKSFGINLTEERLKLISQSNETYVTVDDLYENEVPAGTRVTIKIAATFS